MSTQPNVDPKLPAELLSSIFELVSPKALMILIRCSRRFFEICNPLLYEEVHLHTPTQLVALSEHPKAMQMLKTTKFLVIDDLILYLEAWDSAGAGESPGPFHYLLRVLRATTTLRSLKVSHSPVPIGFSRRADWGSDPTSEFLHTAGDPGFLPSLTLIGVYNSSRTDESWFEAFCYDRVIECYSTWNDKLLHVNIFPALERSGAVAPDPSLSALAVSQLASYPKQYISGRELGRLIGQPLDLDHRSNITHLGLLLQFPNTMLHGKPSPIHNTYSWLKDVLSMSECPRLQGLHVRFKSLPLDWEASLDEQRLGLEGLQKIAPELVAVGMSSTGLFWNKWVPTSSSDPLCSTVPHWTPCPVVDPGTRVDVRAVLAWWLEALGLDISSMQDREIMKDFAKRLSAAMYERWGFMVPSEDILYDRLLSHF